MITSICKELLDHPEIALWSHYSTSHLHGNSIKNFHADRTLQFLRKEKLNGSSLAVESFHLDKTRSETEPLKCLGSIPKNCQVHAL